MPQLFMECFQHEPGRTQISKGRLQAGISRNPDHSRSYLAYTGDHVMRQLTQWELKDAFRTTDEDKIRDRVAFWNNVHPDDQIEIVQRRTGGIDIYRENLPDAIEAVLASHEARGRVYTNINDQRVAA